MYYKPYSLSFEIKAKSTQVKEGKETQARETRLLYIIFSSSTPKTVSQIPNVTKEMV